MAFAPRSGQLRDLFRLYRNAASVLRIWLKGKESAVQAGSESTARAVAGVVGQAFRARQSSSPLNVPRSSAHVRATRHEDALVQAHKECSPETPRRHQATEETPLRVAPNVSNRRHHAGKESRVPSSKLGRMWEFGCKLSCEGTGEALIWTQLCLEGWVPQFSVAKLAAL